MPDVNIPSNSTPNPQDFFLGGDFSKEQKSQVRKQFLAEIWQKIRYYWSIVWPYIYKLISFIAYEVVKVVRGIIHIATSQIRQED